MIETIKSYSGVVALVILAIMAFSSMGNTRSQGVFGSTACSGITCLSGGLRLVSDAGGDFESDVAATLASTLSVTGLTSLSTLNTSGRIAVATTTPSSNGDVVISGTGTTTLMLGTSAANKGTAFQMLNDAGALECAYIHSTSLVIVAGACK